MYEIHDIIMYEENKKKKKEIKSKFSCINQHKI